MAGERTTMQRFIRWSSSSSTVTANVLIRRPS
jgi:hypothetical protein